MVSLERTIKTLDLKPETSKGWSLERVGIAVAIAVGIGSTIATAVAASYAGMQADLSRQALSSNERNKAFEGLVGAMSAYCEALDFSKGRSELTWSVDRGTEKYRIVASYRDIGTQFQQPSALGAVHEQLHKLEASAVPLGIWFDSDSVSFMERTVFSLKREFVGAFGPRARQPAAARHMCRWLPSALESARY
ncbi:hypothetical protein BTE77_21140 [Ensifer adhaerens]|nr:hypothetical protein BTE77_21140 [Ensifer adhaerens]